MAESISLVLLLLGAIFMLLAAIGLVRMPDVLIRLHSSTKSATENAAVLAPTPSAVTRMAVSAKPRVRLSVRNV